MTHIESRASTAAQWASDNPVLYLHELGWETDTSKAKMGDGVTAWSALPYFFIGAPTKASVGLSNVDNTADVDKPVSTATTAALAGKASLASPVFTGDPKAPTAASTDNDTSIATTAFVRSAIANYSAVKVTIGSDVNTLTTTGMYVVNNAANMPYAITSGYVIVNGGTGTTFVSQILVASNRTWYRTYDGTTWTPWREMTGVFTVAAATTTNDTLTGLAARDGYTPVAGDLMLVKDQTATAPATAAAGNGIYVAASGAWARWTFADTSAEVAALGRVRVINGTVNANTHWTTTFTAGNTLGTTAMQWNTADGPQPYVTRELTTAQPSSGTTTAVTVLQWQTARVAQGGIVWDATNFRFYVPKAGRYDVHAQVGIVCATANNYNSITVRKNGTDYRRKWATTPAANVIAFAAIDTVIVCAAGDYIDFTAFANTAAFSVEGLADGRSEAMITYLGL